MRLDYTSLHSPNRAICPHCESDLLFRRPSATSSETANKTATSRRIACDVGIVIMATLFLLILEVPDFLIIATHLFLRSPGPSSSASLPAPAMVVGIRLRSDVGVSTGRDNKSIVATCLILRSTCHTSANRYADYSVDEKRSAACGLRKMRVST